MQAGIYVSSQYLNCKCLYRVFFKSYAIKRFLKQSYVDQYFYQEPGLCVQRERPLHRGCNEKEPVPGVQVQEMSRGQQGMEGRSDEEDISIEGEVCISRGNTGG